MVTGLLVAGASVGASVYAMGPYHGHMGHATRGLGPNAPLRSLIHGEVGRLAALHSDLGVTDEQRDRIHAVLQGYRGEFAPMVEDLSVTETAERTGWTETMVKVQSHRARTKLKTLMEQTERKRAQ